MKLAVALALALLSSPALAQSDLPPAWATGALNPAVTQSNIHHTICLSGYTRTVRPPSRYTSNLKHRQMLANALPGAMQDYEEDHLIPLELGGHPTKLANLWPEPRHSAWNAARKDVLENRLHALVCSGTVPLAEAQREFATDWIAAYGRYVGGAP